MLKFEVIGNLGADAVKGSKDGREFVTFRVAHTEKFTDKAGVENESVQWVSCVMSGDGGRVLQYLKKGQKVFVTGNGRSRLYSSPKDKCMKAGLDMQVTHIELCGGGGSNDQVPSRLYNTDTGLEIPIFKAFFISEQDAAALALGKDGVNLADSAGSLYHVEESRFVEPLQNSNDGKSE